MTNQCNEGHDFEYAMDLNYYNGVGPKTIEIDGEIVAIDGEVLSIADQYRCIRCGLIDTVE